MIGKENSEQPGFLIQGSEAFKVAQALYNTVTGKTEKLSKRFSEHYRIGLNDIFQLHSKIDQMCAQWTVIDKNENITIHHINDNKETFSSLERFKVYDQSQTSPIESIVYEFNLLIQLTNTPKPQPYQITVRLGSIVAAQQKAREEMPTGIFFRFFGGGAINVDIKYVDYVVARNMISTIDSWVAGVESSPKNKLLRYIQNHSHIYENLFGYFLFILALLTGLSSVDLVLNSTSNDQLLSKFLLATFGFVSISLFIGKTLGSYTESAIDRVMQISYIKINKGDERIIESAKKSNNLSIFKAFLSSILVTIHAVSCSFIAAILYELIQS